MPRSGRRSCGIFGIAVALLALLIRHPVAAVPADSTRVDSLQSPSPRSVLIRSAILPGWGQFANHKPFKGICFAAASAGLLSAAVAEHRSIGEAVTPAEQEDRAARRNTRILLFALSTTMAALDAYIDAHLADFSTGEEIVALTPHRGGILLRLERGW